VRIIHTAYSKLFITGIVIITGFSGCDKNDFVRKDPEEYKEFKVMTYNILYSTSNESTISTIRRSGADIIGLQEVSRSRIQDLQQKLGFYFYSFPKTTANMSDQDTGILSRFKIVRFLNDGVVIKINPFLNVAVFTVHLSPYPYQPYDFRDGKISTEAQAIASASFRLREINPVIEQINSIKKEGIPVFLTGDFNEPSHLDWTDETASVNLHFGKTVVWPVSKAITDAGLTDAYRLKFTNAANFPGNTWTTIESSNEVYDRIDMIYHTQSEMYNLQDIRLVGGPGDSAGITVDDYSSDHYAVLATYELNN